MMRRFLVIICLIVCWLSGKAYQADFVLDGIGYYISSARYPATVRAVTAEKNRESFTIPKEVTYQGHPFEVTEIEYELFKDNLNLKSVDIQADLVEIPRRVFSGCKNLEKVNGMDNIRFIPTGTFDGCTSLVSFPAFPNVEEIDETAFINSSIRNIKGMVKLKVIGKQAFSGCGELTSIAGPSALRNIASEAFLNCGKLSEVCSLSSLEEIGSHAFYGCKSLTELPELSLLKKIERSYFEGSGIKKFPSMPRLEEIGDEVFMNYGFETLPDFPALKKIGNRAFAGNDFKNIKFSSAVELGEYAFADCKKLETVDMQYIRHISVGCFSGCIKLKNYIHGPGLRIINALAFENTDLRSFPDAPNLSFIGGEAFNGVSKIESITLHSIVKGPLVNCFAGMTGVKSITIENGFTIDFLEMAVLKDESWIKDNFIVTEYGAMPLERVEIYRPINWLGTFQTYTDPYSEDNDSRWRKGYGEKMREFIPPYPNLKEVRISHEGGAYPPPFYNPDTHIIFDCDGMEMPPKIKVNLKEDDEYYFTSDWSKSEYKKYLQDTKKVTFGPRVKKIWAECFSWVKDIYCYALTPPEFLESTFANRIYLDATLHVPAEAVEAYKAAPGWREFYNIKPSAVEEIGCGNENVPAEYYDLNGRKVSDKLTPGIYIERKGGEVRKVVIK